MAKRIFIIGFLLSVMGLPVLPAFSAATINTNIPGVTDKTGPCGFVFGFYTFALMIGGVLAFAAITYGGVKYTLAAGNPSGQSEGKEWVKGAIYGLLLLVGAYLVLNLINPDLTKCALPKLAQIAIAPPSGNGCPVSLPAGGSTDANVNPCIDQAPGGPCSAAAVTCASGSSCSEITDPSGFGVTTVACGPSTIPNCNPTSDNLGTAKVQADSPDLTSFLGCTNGAGLHTNFTWQGQHTCKIQNGLPVVSCHFGGISCTDGAHAVDLGKGSSATFAQALAAAQSCGASSGKEFFCECELGTSAINCAAADHIHCNITASKCGCQNVL